MIGLCCQYLIKNKKNDGYVNAFAERHLQYNRYINGKYSHDQVISTWINNVENIKNTLNDVTSSGINSFRISSNIFPLFDCVPNDLLHENIQIKNILLEIGKYIIHNNIRLTCHPDQFVVLSSKNKNVIEKSKKILKHHAWVMDSMMLPNNTYYAINIHGGVKGSKDTLINSIQELPENVSGRLTLENDERCYSVKDLYSVYTHTRTPIVFDSHHHVFNDNGDSIDEALYMAMSTWSGIKPLSHLSNTDPNIIGGSFMQRRKHSDYVHYIPECQRQANNAGILDIDFEFKMKNIAIMKAIKDFDILLK